MEDDKKSKKKIELEDEKEDLVWEEDKEAESDEEEEVKEEGEKTEKDEDEEAGVKEEEENEEEEQAEEEEKEEDLEEESEKDEDSDESEDEEEERPTHEEIRKSDVLRRELNQFVRDNQPSYNLSPKSKRPSGKLITLILFILAIAVIGGGIYFVAGLGSPNKGKQESQTPTSTPQPTPTPEALNRSEWYFEVLNGSGVTGEAKRVAEALKQLGYQVTKVGNADKDDYSKHEFYVQSKLEDEVNRVVVDIKDIIKIASISGELTDSTASARIIIGRE